MGADDELPIDSFEIWEKYTRNLNQNERIALRARMKVVSNNKKYNGLVLPKNKKRKNYSGPITLLSRSIQKFILPIPTELPNEDNWWSLCISYFAEREICIDECVVYYTFV